MTQEALDPNKFPAFFVYETITATPLRQDHHPGPASSTTTTFLFDNAGGCGEGASPPGLAGSSPAAPAQARRKRRQRQRSCKNKEEAESQRMTHIAVERNRRRLMNDHLAVLRSLMPESYVQRGDQASVVGGAIDFVKELEQLLQSLEAQKRTLQQRQLSIDHSVDSAGGSASCSNNSSSDVDADLPPFAHFFAYPQYIWCHAPREYPPPPDRRPAVADIEVTLIETHASLRILSPRRPQQLVRMVAGLQALRLSILHLSVTTLDSVVLYSLSAKVEEGCSLTTVDDIAAAVHHMLSLIEAEAEAAGALIQ